jgi:dsDNA-specific endonuclease/ATPase MutS2
MKKQQEIKNLIDKSIGTKGSLKIHSFWMSKILKDAIDLSQENSEDIDELEELHTKELEKLKNNIRQS